MLCDCLLYSLRFAPNNVSYYLDISLVLFQNSMFYYWLRLTSIIIFKIIKYEILVVILPMAYTTLLSLIRSGVDENFPESIVLATRAAVRTQYTYTINEMSRPMKARKIMHVTPTMSHIHHGAFQAVVTAAVVVVVEDVLTKGAVLHLKYTVWTSTGPRL